jgi:hypothetical protein
MGKMHFGGQTVVLEGMDKFAYQSKNSLVLIIASPVEFFGKSYETSTRIFSITINSSLFLFRYRLHIGEFMKLTQKEIQMHQYLKISFWLQKRYTKDGVLTINIGLTPTKYALIENLAWSRFMEQSI